MRQRYARYILFYVRYIQISLYRVIATLCARLKIRVKRFRMYLTDQPYCFKFFDIVDLIG